MWKDVSWEKISFFLFLRKNCSHGERGQKKSRIKAFVRTSLVVQWLGIHLPMQGTWVWSLVWEDLTWCGGTKPMGHTYWSPQALETTPREATAMRSPCITTREQPPLVATRESRLTATKTQHHDSPSKKIVCVRIVQRHFSLWPYHHTDIHMHIHNIHGESGPVPPHFAMDTISWQTGQQDTGVSASSNPPR